ncbi:hypothetical protein [Sorangium atrum]|uniref:Secreted protein n=1 Tax=Sorangium atrum TaxID=2995308 RepID=A0ABT5C2J1_9BACT|nr:hypothetical protein [Sorangium aterium]MDC0680625.1 hypothetical protein [Sorangium aterium]
MLAASGTATAQTEPFLSVTRGAGAESCPDAARLIERVEQLRGRPETGASGSYVVEFTREADGFRASIRSGSGARELRDRSRSCAGLEQATAVTLALLLDSDGQASSPQGPGVVARDAPPPAPPAPSPSASAERPLVARPAPAGAGGGEREAPTSERGATRLTLAAGAAGLFGVVRPFAPALSTELGIGGARFRAAIGALWLVPQTLELGPGELRETMFGGVVRACFAAAGVGVLRFDVCSGVHAGRLKAAASGFTRNDAVEKTWLAIPFELSLASLAGPLGFDVGAAALVPLRRNDFSVDGVGVAYRSPPVGALVSLRGVGSWVL